MKPTKTPEEHLVAALEAAIVVLETMPGLRVDHYKSSPAWDEYPLSAEAFWSVLVGEEHGQSRCVIIARAKLMRRAIRSGWVARALWDHAPPRIEFAEWEGRQSEDGIRVWTQAYSPTLGIKIQAGVRPNLPSCAKHVLRDALMEIAEGTRS